MFKITAINTEEVARKNNDKINRHLTRLSTKIIKQLSRGKNHIKIDLYNNEFTKEIMTDALNKINELYPIKFEFTTEYKYGVEADKQDVAVIEIWKKGETK